MSNPLPAALKIRVRVTRGEEDAFGPGKAQLLESLLQIGSLNQTAAALKMSYVKVFALVKAMNANFREPLVELSCGGRQGGGTKVTEIGQLVLQEYQSLCEVSEKALQKRWPRLCDLLKN